MIWLIVGATAVVALGFFLNTVALRIVRPPKRVIPRTAGDLPLRYEDVSFRSAGRTLRGWLLHPERPDGRAVAILAHGWASNSGEVLPVAEAAVRAGHPTLVFDFRRHGRSDDAPHVTIPDYRDDLIEAIAFVRERLSDRPIVVIGHSMGGAAVILAAAEGAALDGIVTVGAPADLIEMTVEYLNAAGLPGTLLAPLLVPLLWIRAGGRRGHLVPERRMAEVLVPAMVIHPEMDERVPLEHARKLADLADCELRVVPDAGHLDILEHPGLHEAVVEFLARF